MSHAFVCLPTLESTTFEQQLCSAKLGYANALLLGTSSWKKGMWHTSSKKSSATLTVVGLNDKRAAYIASSKFSEPKRFVRRLNKFEGKYIQEQQLNQFHCYNLNRIFFQRMDQSVSKYKTGIRMKKWWWSPFAYMVDVLMLDVVLQNAWVLFHINKDEVDESLPLLDCNFLEIFKERQISLEP